MCDLSHTSSGCTHKRYGHIALPRYSRSSTEKTFISYVRLFDNWKSVYSANWMNGLSLADWQSKPAVRWICRISPWTSKIVRSTLAVVSWKLNFLAFISRFFVHFSFQLDTLNVMCYTDGLLAVELILLQIWNYLNLIWFKLQLEMLQLLWTKVKEVELFEIARSL